MFGKISFLSFRFITGMNQINAFGFCVFGNVSRVDGRAVTALYFPFCGRDKVLVGSGSAERTLVNESIAAGEKLGDFGVV